MSEKTEKEEPLTAQECIDHARMLMSDTPSFGADPHLWHAINHILQAVETLIRSGVEPK